MRIYRLETVHKSHLNHVSLEISRDREADDRKNKQTKKKQHLKSSGERINAKSLDV